jgi:hypothetical protein
MESLERAFADRSAILPIDPLRMKTAISAFVDDAKTANIPIESVLISVKGIARRALLRASRRSVDGTETEAAINTCVTWCIERYYATVEHAPPNPPSDTPLV